MTTIRVVMPAHLRSLAKVNGEVTVEIEGTVTTCSILDALESQYPMLAGTVREHVTKKRRAFVRFFACEQDLSHDSAPSQACIGASTPPQRFMVFSSSRPQDLR